MAIALLIMVLANMMFSVEYYFGTGIKPVSTSIVALSAISLLFALPAQRNAFPGSPPIGCLIDFYAYFWCVFLAIINLAFMGVGFLTYALDEPNIKSNLEAKHATYLATRVHKPLADLTEDEVIALFVNTNRGQYKEGIRENHTTGKLLCPASSSSDLADLGVIPLIKGKERIEFFIDLNNWKKLGVDSGLLNYVEVTMISFHF